MTAAPEDLDRVRRLVAEVRDRPAFQDAEPSILERVLSRLGDLFDPLVRRAGDADLFDVLAWFVVGLVVAAALVGAARGVARRTRGPRPVHDDATDLGQPPTRWAEAARAAAAAGDHREAVRLHLRAGVAALAEEGLLREVAGRTVAEYGRELRRTAPARVAAFDEAAAVFEAVWYAGEQADAGHVATVADAVARLDRDARGAAGREVVAP